MSDLFAVIMAGGSGTRFWPVSRAKRPKQFLSLVTNRTLFEETVLRLEPLIAAEQVYVVAGAQHTLQVQALRPDIPNAQLLVEPCARNTAPCVGLAAIHIAKHNPKAVMAVLPADHHISDAAEFRTLIAAAAERARTGEIVTIGIRPSRPETGYGYIQSETSKVVQTDAGPEALRVLRFVEKPESAVAEQYVADGGYLWNSGMFFFTAERILADMERLLPNLHAALHRIGDEIGTERYDEALKREFEAAKPISIDYGVMERTDNIRVIPGDVGWNDVGHWEALAEYVPPDEDGNVVTGRAVFVDSRENIVHSSSTKDAQGRLIALIGVEGLIVADTGDAILVCRRDRNQDVRQVVELLKSRGDKDLL